MGLKSELESEVLTMFRSTWSERDGQKVPEAEDLELGNDAVKLAGTVLYADLADSTRLVDQRSRAFAAEIYKSFLHAAARIIKSQGGTITAYDGDRIMAVYIGDPKNTPAVRTALKINYALEQIIKPAMKKVYTTTDYVPKHVVGIDTSDLFVARTGVRGANDLVWVGRAANYAAKLAALPETYNTYITEDVFDHMKDEVKFTDGQAMWTPLIWNEFGNKAIYGSNWWWSVA